MKIALAVSRLGMGGAETSALRLAQHLTRNGHDVTICAMNEGSLWAELERCELKGHLFPHSALNSVVQISKSLANFWNQQKFDLVILRLANRISYQAAHMLEDQIGVLAILRNPRPEVHSFIAKHRMAWNVAIGVGPLVQQVGQHHNPGKTVLHVPNGVEIPSRSDLADRIPWSLPLRLVYLGRLLDDTKGIFRLPHIVAACRQRQLPVQLTVIGDGPDREALLHSFQDLNVADSVTMLGFQELDTIPAHLRQHHVLVLPSRSEGLPNVVLEAQANGCVPVATLLPGSTDVAINAPITGRLVENGEIETFVDEIEAMLDPRTWKCASDLAIEQIQQQFSVATMGARYEAVIQDLHAGKYPLGRPFNQSHSLKDVPFGWRDYWPRPGLRSRLGKLARALGRG